MKTKLRHKEQNPHRNIPDEKQARWNILDRHRRTTGRRESIQKQLHVELRRYRERVQRMLGELPEEDGPEDSAGEATRSAQRDSTLGNLERDARTIIEIQHALRRISGGTYGTCAVCKGKILEARLRALPWAGTCIQCAGGRPEIANWERSGDSQGPAD